MASTPFCRCHSPMQAWTLTDSCVLRMMLCFLPRLMETGDKTFIGVRGVGKVTYLLSINLMVWTRPPGEAPDKQKPTLNNYPEILWCHRTLRKIKQWSLTLLDWHRHFIAKPGLPHRVTCTHAWPCWEVFKICAHQVKSLECNSTNLLDHSHGYFYMFSDIEKGHT